MFFPKMQPSQITGQSLQLAATFIGVSMVSIGDAVFAGPLFRDGDRVFLLHADQQPDGKTVSLRFVDIGDRATTRVLEHTAHIAALTERVIADKQTIADLRQKHDAALRELVDGTKVLESARQSLATLQADNAEQAARVASLELSLTAINLDRVEAVNKLVIAEGELSRYVDLVGPLDPMPPTINDEIAEQMKLMEPELDDEAPFPPRLTEPGPAAYVAPGLIGETIAREGSTVDNAFRRLMFLTGGK